jgi:heptosyltransferase-2
MLAEQMPDSQVHYLTKAAFAPLIESNPFVHKVWKWDSKNATEVLQKLADEEFNHVVDLHNNLRSFRVSALLDAPCYRFNKLNIEKWLAVTFKKNSLPNVHIVERYANTLKHIGNFEIPKHLDFFIPDIDLKKAAIRFADYLNEKYIVFCIGAQHRTKQMPSEKWQKLAALLNQKIIIIGGEADQAAAQIIAQKEQVDNLCGQTSLFESAFLLQHASAVITHDTGMMHIASAFNKPIVSIWGNTIPQFGMYPYGVSKSFFAEVKNLDCRPCSKIGFKQCPKKHFACMVNQDLKSIADQINDWAKF